MKDRENELHNEDKDEGRERVTCYMAAPESAFQERKPSRNKLDDLRRELKSLEEQGKLSPEAMEKLLKKYGLQ